VERDGQLRAWLDRLAALGGVVSAAEAIVADGEQILFRHASGYRVGGERLQAGTGARFDAASLAKPWMATLALRLAAAPAGDPWRLALDAPLAGTVDATLEDLLRHRSGLPAWTPLALRLGRRLAEPEALRRQLLELRTSTAATVYSDLGYVLWGLLAEAGTGATLAALLDERVAAPLGVASLGAMAARGDVGEAVECRLDNGKEIELAASQGLKLARQRSHLLGVPQDGNARALLAVGRLPAHAGLFVNADELLALGREWLRPERLLRPAQVAAALAGEGDYALGWARWSESGAAGPALSRSSFGHAGFTGGSLWVDPERGRIYLLLAHRLSSAIDFNPFRREFHRLASEL
jgi:CubicO group peptidase (beta-lactamase class C family)